MSYLPHVTDILPWHGPQIDQYYLERGKAVHLAIHLDILDKLDEKHLKTTEWADEVIPKLEQFRRFRKESGIEILETELHLESPFLCYQGTIDLIGIFSGRRYIIDIKGYFDKLAAVQLAAYRQLYFQVSRAQSIPSVLELRTDRYKMHDSITSDLFGSADFQVFKYYQAIHNFEIRNGLKTVRERS
jgi:hypothetical protein